MMYIHHSHGVGGQYKETSRRFFPARMVGASETSSSSTDPTSPSPDRPFEWIFRRFDKNQDGRISPEELRNFILLAGEEMSEEEAAAAVELVDSDGDGMLRLEDFVEMAGGGAGYEEEKRRSLRRAFRVYEMDGEDCITARSLRVALGRLGERRTVEECEIMIRRFDINGDGVLSFDEFQVMML
ncbi:Calcium-binding protein CML38 [Platanthera zijinensis]|uniref:Calcium-binding protein CML38 n=1 Tax=Platanthera zijinensis TaxID=2320716 RepID=A0AAP0GFJ5_9ASPA